MTLVRKQAARRRDEPSGVMNLPGYEDDFYGWALAQADLLRTGELQSADLANVAEEIEGLARNEFDKFVSFLGLVLVHILKCEYQPGRQTRSWLISIALHRDHARSSLEENPSFKPRLGEALEKAYRRARLQAARETKLPVSSFPERCPHGLEDVLSRPFPVD